MCFHYLYSHAMFQKNILSTFWIVCWNTTSDHFQRCSMKTTSNCPPSNFKKEHLLRTVYHQNFEEKNIPLLETKIVLSDEAKLLLASYTAPLQSVHGARSRTADMEATAQRSKPCLLFSL